MTAGTVRAGTVTAGTVIRAPTGSRRQHQRVRRIVPVLGGALSLYAIGACAMDVPAGYVSVATLYGIPPTVLYAVGLAESRKTTPVGRRPWPWTLNVDGESRFYPSRRDAWTALQTHIRAGRTVDVGLMQVNWNWHSVKLVNAWRALDPYFNLRVGAQILREQFDITGDWHSAIGRYHAPANTPKGRANAQKYRENVARLMKDLTHAS